MGINQKLLAQGAFGCVYYPALKCKNKVIKNSVSKLQIYDWNAKNEINIGSKIKKIKSKDKFFAYVYDFCKVNISKIDSRLLTDCKIIQNYPNNLFVNLFLKYINRIGFKDYVLMGTSKEIIYKIVTTFSSLLKGYNKLLKKNIVHMDIKDDNLIYDTQSKSVKIIDFGISIEIENVHKNLYKNFYVFGPDYYIWCLEIHCINYILHKSPKFTAKSIDEICLPYINNNPVFYNDTLKEHFYIQAKKYLKRYIGKPRSYIIDECLSSYNKWDIHALSILYLRIFYTIIHDKNITNDWITEFYLMLYKNLHPNPNKRLTFMETMSKINELNNKNVYNILDKISV